MEMNMIKGLPWSRLMLGTVQFGIEYGVANRTGQPAYKEILKILQTALAHGVSCLDTAAAYGSSEEVLGRALRELNALDQVTVVTKVKPLGADVSADSETAARLIESSVAESRARLGLDCLPLVLFHREADARCLDVLQKLKDRGWIRYAGVSCDNNPAGAVRFLADDRVDGLQIPANLLDQRHRNQGIFSAAAAAGKAIFVRSVFLQGLLLMNGPAVPPHLAAVVPALETMTAIGRRHDLDPGALALRYILSLPGVTSVLTGVETEAQLLENIRLVKAGGLPCEVVTEIEAAVPTLPDYVITPALWESGKSK